MNIIYSASIRRDGTLTYEQAIAQGYRTVGLGQRVWEMRDSAEQERTGSYRGFTERKCRNRIYYAVRFPAVHVVKPAHWDVFIIRVPSFADALRLARKGGDGTVIQRVEIRYRAIDRKRRKGKSTASWVAARLGRRGKDTPYRYWIVRDGFLERTEPIKIVRIEADEV
jgi:hypothetical protein